MLRWKFQTRNFRIEFETFADSNYRYDGDDENGETQAALDSGEFVAFDSRVSVYFRGDDEEEPIGVDHLGGSVYAADSISDFWTEHRSADPMNRNCSIMRDSHPAGPRVSICHYFPDMVRQAIREAREEMLSRKAAAARLPYIREEI